LPIFIPGTTISLFLNTGKQLLWIGVDLLFPYQAAHVDCCYFPGPRPPDITSIGIIPRATFQVIDPAGLSSATFLFYVDRDDCRTNSAFTVSRAIPNKVPLPLTLSFCDFENPPAYECNLRLFVQSRCFPDRHKFHRVILSCLTVKGCVAAFELHRQLNSFSHTYSPFNPYPRIENILSAIRGFRQFPRPPATQRVIW